MGVQRSEPLAHGRLLAVELERALESFACFVTITDVLVTVAESVPQHSFGRADVARSAQIGGRGLVIPFQVVGESEPSHNFELVRVRLLERLEKSERIVGMFFLQVHVGQHPSSRHEPVVGCEGLFESHFSVCDFVELP